MGVTYPIRDHNCVPFVVRLMRTRGHPERERRGRRQWLVDENDDTCNNADMSNRRRKPTLTDVLKDAIEQSGLTCYRIGKDNGIHETNLRRFLRGELSIRLDKADSLAVYLGLRLVPDPDAVPPEPTPENLARPMLAKNRATRKA
jgi:hypothetical protein